MPQRRGGAARRQFDDMLVAFVVSVEIAKRAFDAIALARPGADLHRFHVFDVNAADQRRALALAPFLIHIECGQQQAVFPDLDCWTMLMADPPNELMVRFSQSYSERQLHVKFKSMKHYVDRGNLLC